MAAAGAAAGTAAGLALFLLAGAAAAAGGVVAVVAASSCFGFARVACWWPPSFMHAGARHTHLLRPNVDSAVVGRFLPPIMSRSS